MTKFIVALAVIGGLVFWMKRRQQKPERSIDKVMHSIRKSDLPERSKKGMLRALDEAQTGLSTLRETAGELARKAS